MNNYDKRQEIKLVLEELKSSSKEEVIDQLTELLNTDVISQDKYNRLISRIKPKSKISELKHNPETFIETLKN